MRGIIVVGLFIGIVSTGTYAEMYKCVSGGKISYTDIPCISGRVLATTQTKPLQKNENPAIVGSNTCINDFRSHVQFKDPDSVKVIRVETKPMGVSLIKGVSLVTRRYEVYVNAKNSYGGYIGEKPLICLTSEDGKRILAVSDAFLN